MVLRILGAGPARRSGARGGFWVGRRRTAGRMGRGRIAHQLEEHSQTADSERQGDEGAENVVSDRDEERG